MFPLSLGFEEIIAPYLSSEKMVDRVSIMIKIFLMICAAYVAIACPSFSYLCALTGMICTMSVSVIFPALAHYKLFHEYISWKEKMMDIIIVLFGTGMAVVGTILTIQQQRPK